MTIVCEPDPQAARVLAAVIGGEVQSVSALSTVSVLLAAILDPCFVVVGATIGLDEALRFSAQAAVEHPDARVLLVREQPSDAEIRRARAAGVVAVFDTGAHDQIAHACSVPVGPRADGQIYAVFAAKGGYGKTTLATNLALALQSGGERRVCLLDLDLDYGDVASVLDLATTRTLARLIECGEVGALLDQRRADHHRRAPRAGLHPRTGGAR